MSRGGVRSDIDPRALAGRLPKGERIYAMGNPLDLGFTIVEGTYNGLVDKSYDERIHFSGAINPGMSGGPLCVQYTNDTYYPAAVYLGGSAQTVVRAIDGAVADLVNRADVSANTGDNNTGGGVVLLAAHCQIVFIGLNNNVPLGISTKLVPAKTGDAVFCQR